MVNFLCTPPCSRTALTVAMETMHFFIVQLSLSLRTKILCISGVPITDLAPMKNCPGGGGGGCKVGQISSRGNIFLIFAPKHRLWVLVWTASARRF